MVSEGTGCTVFAWNYTRLLPPSEHYVIREFSDFCGVIALCCNLILDDAGVNYPEVGDEMFLDKSPEYWAGWALACYQWSTALSFMDILRAASLDDIIHMYPLYHEMDLSHFVEQMDRLIKEAYPQTRLRERRSNCGLSQSELASEADVPLRQIQLFEQGQRDINKTSAITLLKLSKALHCRMEDLLEPERV